MSDYRTTTGEPLPKSPRDVRRQRRFWIKRAAWVMMVVIVTGFVIPVRIRVAASGYVTAADYAEVRPSAAGQVAEIHFFSGQRVNRGDIMVRLNDGIEVAMQEEARSAVQRMEAELIKREAELAQRSRARGHHLAQAVLRFNHAAAVLNMTADLYKKGLDSGKALEDRRLARALAEAEITALQDEDETLAEKELDVMRRELDVRRSALAGTEARLHTRRIHAPVSGDVVRYEFVIGELISPDSVLYEIFGGENLILKLRIPERHATRVNPGAPYKARLKISTGWGGHRFTGTVTDLRAVIQSDTQQTYRMAYCTFDPGEHAIPPGASAEARITVATVPFWIRLFGAR